MIVKTAGIREGFVTHRAHKGLFSCVFSTVFVQVTGPVEGLVTGGAGEGLNSCVCHFVSLQDSRLRESLVTLGAGIWFLPGVDSHVNTQGI